MRRFAGFVVVSALVAGCGGGSKSSGAPAPVTITLPHWTVPAGQELLKCVYLNLHNPKYAWVNSFTTHQGQGGHHMVAFVSSQVEPDGTEVDCADAQSMQSFRPLLVPVDVGAGTHDTALPEGYGILVPAEAEIVYQSHYVNASPQDITTDDSFDINFLPQKPAPTEVNTWLTTRLNFDVPPGQIGTAGLDCIAPQDMNVFLTYGHMHEWGKELSLDVGPDEQHMSRIYDIQNWQAQYRDNPPRDAFGFDTPLEVHAGDHMHLNCTWDNTQGITDLTFPIEMCVGVFWFYPAPAIAPICSD